jgi:capsule polysaccharide export protein KpsE/RkpR
MAKRHNIDTIAEVLIDKIDSLEKNTKRLEKSVDKAVSTELKIDTSELQRMYLERQQQEKQFLDDLRALNEKKQSRLPNWVIVSLMVFVLSVMAFVGFTWSRGEDYKMMEAERDFYLKKLNEYTE